MQGVRRAGSDTNPKQFHTLKEFFEKVNFEKKVSRGHQKREKLPSMQGAKRAGSDTDPKQFHTLKEFFEKVNFKKKVSRRHKSVKNYPACKELKEQGPIQIPNSLTL